LTIEIEVGWKLFVVLILAVFVIASGIAARRARKTWPDREDL